MSYKLVDLLLDLEAISFKITHCTKRFESFTLPEEYISKDTSEIKVVIDEMKDIEKNITKLRSDLKSRFQVDKPLQHFNKKTPDTLVNPIDRIGALKPEKFYFGGRTYNFRIPNKYKGICNIKVYDSYQKQCKPTNVKLFVDVAREPSKEYDMSKEGVLEYFTSKNPLPSGCLDYRKMILSVTIPDSEDFTVSGGAICFDYIDFNTGHDFCHEIKTPNNIIVIKDHSFSTKRPDDISDEDYDENTL